MWHTNAEGSYSGQTPRNDFCLLDQGYRGSDFFRGVRTTAADGTVYFDTCFPGWYPGRAIHIHFQVRDGANEYRVSQLFFPAELIESIFADHPDYSAYGQPDTRLADDNIAARIDPAGQAALTLAVSRMADGAMLASKVVTVV